MRPRSDILGVVLLMALGCAGQSETRYVLDPDQAAQYPTAYIAEVVAAAEGGDLVADGGEHVVIRSNFELRTDLGGWVVQTGEGHRLPLGVGRQLDPGEELRVHPACGSDTDRAVFACLETAVLPDDGGTVILLDAAGTEVARFAYGEPG
jgi:hypothetical protein